MSRGEFLILGGMELAGAVFLAGTAGCGGGERRGSPEGLVTGATPLRTSRARAYRMVRGAVPPGATAGLLGSGGRSVARPGRPRRATRSAVGSAPRSEGTDAHHLGRIRSRIPRLSNTRSSHPPPRGSLELIPDCGHLPHVERVPTTSSPPSTGFSANTHTAERWQPRESQACLPSADRSA